MELQGTSGEAETKGPWEAHAASALTQEAYNAIEASHIARNRSLGSPPPDLDPSVEAFNLDAWAPGGGAADGIPKGDVPAEFQYSSGVVEAEEVFLRTLQAVVYPISTLATKVSAVLPLPRHCFQCFHGCVTYSQSRQEALAAISSMIIKVFQLFNKRGRLPSASEFTGMDYVIMLLRAARVVERQLNRLNTTKDQPYYRKEAFSSEERFVNWRKSENERLSNLLKQLNAKYEAAVKVMKEEEDRKFDEMERERRQRMNEVYGPALERQLRGFCSRLCIIRRKKWQAQLTQSQRNLRSPIERNYAPKPEFPQADKQREYESGSDFEEDELWPSSNLQQEGEPSAPVNPLPLFSHHIIPSCSVPLQCINAMLLLPPAAASFP